MEIKERGKFYTAVSILVGTSIGAGVLGLPYVAAKVGFLIVLAYIIFVGLLIMLLNLYLGEVALRTKEDHQLAGYAKKYLGKLGEFFTEFALIFGVYAALVAYMLGMGQSFSFLFFQNPNSHVIQFGILTGVVMSGLLWRGLRALKRFEKIGVGLILFLLLVIFLFFIPEVKIQNLMTFNSSFIFLPFGVVLFSLLSFHAIPELKLVLKGKEELMKRIILTGSLVVIVSYLLFTFVVVGFMGSETPRVATLSLGNVFVFLGILTMFTSYLALGNAIDENFIIDDRMSKMKSWFFSAIVPIFVFVFIKTFAGEFFSFTKILGIGGVVSGGLIAIMTLLMAAQAKKHGNRNPEYSIPLNKGIIGIISLVFISAVVREIFLVLR